MTIKELKENPVKLIADDWALVSAGTPEKWNTLTVSWGGIGELWGRDVAFIFIRPQRYTKKFIDEQDYFTISFFDPEYKDMLRLCGRISGRDCDKIKEAGLSLATDGEAVYPAEARLTLKCKNDRKNSYIRSLQKQLRPESINSAFCQNAFDTAFTKLSNRLDAVRLEMLRTIDSIFCQSKILFGLCLDGAGKDEMTSCLNEVVRAVRNKKDTAFYMDCIAQLQNMSADEFDAQMVEFHDLYDMVSVQFRIPHVKSEAIPFDSRLMKIEPSTDTAMPYVITLSDPFAKGHRFSIPVSSSRHSLHKIQNNRMAAAVTVKPEGTKVRIGWSYTKSFRKPDTAVCMGVDTGIKDSFFLSDGRSIGSMKEDTTMDYIKQLKQKKM